MMYAMQLAIQLSVVRGSMNAGLEYVKIDDSILVSNKIYRSNRQSVTHVPEQSVYHVGLYKRLAPTILCYNIVNTPNIKELMSLSTRVRNAIIVLLIVVIIISLFFLWKSSEKTTYGNVLLYSNFSKAYTITNFYLFDDLLENNRLNTYGSVLLEMELNHVSDLNKYNNLLIDNNYYGFVLYFARLNNYLSDAENSLLEKDIAFLTQWYSKRHIFEEKLTVLNSSESITKEEIEQLLSAYRDMYSDMAEEQRAYLDEAFDRFATE